MQGLENIILGVVFFRRNFGLKVVIIHGKTKRKWSPLENLVKSSYKPNISTNFYNHSSIFLAAY
jgi:hypothetical protein